VLKAISDSLSKRECTLHVCNLNEILIYLFMSLKRTRNKIMLYIYILNSSRLLHSMSFCNSVCLSICMDYIHIHDYLILPAAQGPAVYTASNRNEYQKHKNNNVSGE
jgi:hypothetical protein